MKACVIGGDARMPWAAVRFADYGIESALAGFEKLILPKGIINSPLEAALQNADFVLLPVKPVISGAVNAPHAHGELSLARLSGLIGERMVFCGFADELYGKVKAPVFEYATREDFCIQNAVLTAEGALCLAAEEYPGSLFGSSALVLGYGRIGRILSRYLRALGARVSAAVRRPEASALAQVEGIDPVDYSINEINEYDLIFNTVPAQVLTADIVSRIKKDALIIDLASAPGGVDSIAAADRGVKLIHALSLPGRTAPKAAGRIIADTVISVIKEDNGGKDKLRLRNDGLLLHL